MILSSLKSLTTMLTSKDGFFCQLPLTSKTYFKLYEKPGRWCTDQEIADLVRDLRQIAADGQSGKPVPEYGVLKGEREDLSQRVISVAYDSETDEPIGFSAQIYLNIECDNFRETVLHLGLIYISPKAQGKNVSYLLAMLPNILLLLKSGLRRTWVSNVTQVPAVLGLVDKNYSQAYPSVKEGAQQSFFHRKLAELIMRDHREAFGVGDDAEFDADKQIIRNAYTGGSDNMKKSFAESTKHRDQRINDLCEKELDYERGDDFLQLAIMGPESVVELFQNKKSRQSFVIIVFNLILFGIAAALLPIIRWMISDDALIENKTLNNGFIYE